MARLDWREASKLAAVVTLAVILVNWAFGTFLKMAVQPLFVAIQPVSVVTATVGEKVLGWISGIIPMPEMFGSGIVITFISALVVIMIGSYIIDSLKVPVFRNFFGMAAGAGRIASILLWGAIPVYLVLIGFQIPSIGILIGVVLHAILVAIVAVWIAGFLRIKI